MTPPFGKNIALATFVLTINLLAFGIANAQNKGLVDNQRSGPIAWEVGGSITNLSGHFGVSYKVDKLGQAHYFRKLFSRNNTANEFGISYYVLGKYRKGLGNLTPTIGIAYSSVTGSNYSIEDERGNFSTYEVSSNQFVIPSLGFRARLVSEKSKRGLLVSSEAAITAFVGYRYALQDASVSQLAGPQNIQTFRRQERFANGGLHFGVSLSFPIGTFGGKGGHWT